MAKVNDGLASFGTFSWSQKWLSYLLWFVQPQPNSGEFITSFEYRFLQPIHGPLTTVDFKDLPRRM